MLRDTQTSGSEKMGIREKLNTGKVGTVAAVAMLLVAAIIVCCYFWPRGPHINYRMAFYSDDDGQTYFEDSVYKFPPFDHNGKTAVGAVVYVDAHNNKFVGYLMRFTPETKKKLQQIYDDTSATGTSDQVQQAVLDYIQAPRTVAGGTEVKLPGEANQWMLQGRRVLPIKMPDGGTVGEMVLP